MFPIRNEAGMTIWYYRLLRKIASIILVHFFVLNVLESLKKRTDCPGRGHTYLIPQSDYEFPAARSVSPRNADNISEKADNRMLCFFRSTWPDDIAVCQAKNLLLRLEREKIETAN